MSQRTREQVRAERAYVRVGEVARDKSGLADEYKAIANGFGALVLKNGLVAALAFVQRSGNTDARDRYLDDLAGAKVPGLEGATKTDLFQRVLALDVSAYMLATRELLAVALWLRRAAQVTLEGADEKKEAGGARRDW